MSLVNLVLRLATRQAILGMTMAGQRVCDSSIDPIELKASKEKTVFIVVYTDDDKCEQVNGHDLLGAARSVTLVLHLAVASEVEDNQGDLTAVIPYTDGGMEVTLDLTRFDLMSALQNGTGDWAELWRSLVIGISKIETRRGADAKGVRFAAREIAITLDTYAEPEGLHYPWTDVDRVLRDTPETAPFADMLLARINGQALGDDFESLRAFVGQSRAVLRMLGAGGETLAFET